MTSEVLTALRIWAQGLVTAGAIERCFVFGSLIHRGGDQFDPLESDIDLVLLLPHDPTAIGRWRRVVTLRGQCALLERDLWITLKRVNPKKSLLSFHLLTPLEAMEAIHKGKDAQLLFMEQFYDLSWSDGGKSRISDRILSGFHDRYRDEIGVLQYLQEIRSDYLKVNVHREFKLGDWDDPKDPLPKPLMREAAKLSAVRSPLAFGAEEVDKIDVSLGLGYITRLVDQRASEAEDIQGLQLWLSTRRAARGRRVAMTADQFLLLTELLYDDVVAGIELPPGRLMPVEPRRGRD
jgi:hypothetical protein